MLNYQQHQHHHHKEEIEVLFFKLPDESINNLKLILLYLLEQ
jgi:hypothetical protein